MSGKWVVPELLKSKVKTKNRRKRRRKVGKEATRKERELTLPPGGAAEYCYSKREYREMEQAEEEIH